MAIKLAINGFGRIGRQTARALLEKYNIGEFAESQILQKGQRRQIFAGSVVK